MFVVKIISHSIVSLGILFFIGCGVAWAEQPEISSIDPIVVTQHTPSILIKGEGWGAYDDRIATYAILNPIKNDELTILNIILTFERNYRLEDGKLMVRALLPKDLDEATYQLAVFTQSKLYAEGYITKRLVPDMLNAQRPMIAVTPQSGPVGTPFILTVGSFPKRTGLVVSLDGSPFRGTLITDESGIIEEQLYAIPPSIEKDKKTIAITPGKHTIKVDTKLGMYQTVTFTVTEKEEKKEGEKDEKEEKKKDEQQKRKTDEVKSEKTNQENGQELKKEETKKNVKQNITTKDTHEKPFFGKPCDSNLPRVWQEGCVDQTEKIKMQSPSVQYYVSESVGKPCKEEIAITFQPGCVPQARQESSSKPFLGKPCNSNLPRVWQEGCTEPVIMSVAEQQNEQIIQPSGKTCNPLIPKYSQPGCRE